MGGERQSSLPHEEVVRMAAEIVSAYVSHNPLPTQQVPEAIRAVFGSLREMQSRQAARAAGAPVPVVSIRKSITRDYLICLEDGKKLKMLKRHLTASHGMTPDQYRAKWNLPPGYRMVAPNYSKQRSAFAKKIGLGRKRAGGKRKRGRAKRR